MSRRVRLWLITAIVLGAAIAAFAWNSARGKVVPVEVVRIERGTVEQTATNSRAGTVTARRRARLSPDFGGRVVAIPHRQGDTVRAGDVVLELDAVLERGEVALRQRQVTAARADSQRACLGAEGAAREVARTRQLASDGILSADLLDRLETQAQEAAAGCRAATAQAESAQSALEQARSSVSKRTLHAPFDGVVADVTIEVGEWTTPSPPALPVPPVIDILDPSTIYLELPMDEVDAARLSPGQLVRATIDSHPGATYPGRVVRVAPYVLDVETQNRTVAIEVELEDQAFARRLLPGTSADIEVILDTHAGVLRVPAASVLAGDKVLVVEDGRIRERGVETGLRNWDFIEIVSGLAEGDQVVTSLDRPEVRAGARAEVTVRATGAAGAAPASAAAPTE